MDHLQECELQKVNRKEISKAQPHSEKAMLSGILSFSIFRPRTGIRVSLVTSWATQNPTRNVQ